MAKALKCDRCGKYYDLHRPPRIIDYDAVGSNKDSLLDLCEDCYDALLQFLFLKAKEEDTNEQMEASDTDDTDNS
jgi:hypothetical protein